MMTALNAFRLTEIEHKILQHKVANQKGDPKQSPLVQLHTLLGQ
jgi:hypothetical protein